MRQGKGNPLATLFELLRTDIKNETTTYALQYILDNPVNMINEDNIKKGYAVLNREDFNYKLLDDFPKIFNNVLHIIFFNIAQLNIKIHIKS